MELARFQKLGFSKNEVMVYLHLAEHGNCSAQALARALHLPRSTIYSVLESLERQRLVRLKKTARATSFVAADPRVLVDLMTQQESELKEKKALAESIAAELLPLLGRRSYELPKLEFVEGHAKLETFLYDNLGRWRDSILRHDKSTWGYQDHTFVEQFGVWLKHAVRVLHVEAGIRGSILSNRSSVELKLRGKIPRREVRLLAKGVHFESSTWVMGDYVVIIMTRRSPVYAFQIHEPLLAANLRLLFQELYASGKSVEKTED